MYRRTWLLVGLALSALAAPLWAQGWPASRLQSWPTSQPQGWSPAQSQGWPPRQPQGRPASQPAFPSPPMPAVNSQAEPQLRVNAWPEPGVGSVEWMSAGSYVEDIAWVGAPNEGVFCQIDALMWSISAPNVTVIGDANSERTVTTPAGVSFRYENSLDTSWIDNTFEGGSRIEFGYVNGQKGWIVTILSVEHSQGLDASGVSYVPNDPNSLLSGYADGNGDGIDDDLDGDNIYGRFGQDLGTSDGGTPPVYGAPFDGAIDTPAPVDVGDQVYWLVTFANVQATSVTEMTGFEWMGIYRSFPFPSESYVEWFYGFRYLKIKDSFGIVGSGGFLDSMVSDTDAKNEIFGPQIGMRWNRDIGYLSLAVESRFAPAINFQRAELQGYTATNANPGGQNAPVSLTSRASNQTRTNTQFAPVGELRFESIYHANPWLGFRVGYTALLCGGISRASEKIVYGLPSFSITDSGSNELLFSSAFSFGVELNR